MNNENQVNGQPVVDTTSNVVGAQPVQPQQPVMEPMQPQGQYQQYQAPQQPVNQYQPQGQYQMYQAPQYNNIKSQYQYRQPAPSVPGNGMCIASLVLGICSLFFWWLPWVNLVIIVLAIIFGIVGLVKKTRRWKSYCRSYIIRLSNYSYNYYLIYLYDSRWNI